MGDPPSPCITARSLAILPASRDTLTAMYRIWTAAALVAFTAPLGVAAPADYPSAEITNGLVQAKVYLPEAQRGFYQGTRFDWSGVIYSLQANGHEYYGPWFQKTDPTVHDFVYRDADIVAGPCSAITGPVDEFGPLGYDEAKASGIFVKIGIGALRKADSSKYDNYHLYEIADGGQWNIRKHRDGLEMTQHLQDAGAGYAYVYQKNLRLVKGKTEMLLTHSLKNTGRRTIQTTVYNHNFLVLDHQPPGPGVTISVPFAIRTSPPFQSELAEVRGQQIVYLRTLEGRNTAATALEGFSQSPQDHQIRIENSRLGAGLSWITDRPLWRESLWSIRTVIAMEPFLSLTIEPGAQFTWTTVYDYYTVPKIAQ
jgi:hypothetical protein